MNNKIDWTAVVVMIILSIVGGLIIFGLFNILTASTIFTEQPLTVAKTAPTATPTPILCTPSPTEQKYLDVLNLWEKDLNLHIQVLNLQIKALTS